MTEPLKRVFLATPFSGTSTLDVARCVRYADACQLHSLMRHEAPIVPQLTYPRVLDLRQPGVRRTAAEATFTWLCFSELVAVYQDLGVCDEMAAAIEVAMAADVPVEYRRIGLASLALDFQPDPGTRGFVLRSGGRL